MTSGASKVLIAVLVCFFVTMFIALFCLKLPQKWAQNIAEHRNARAIELAESRAAAHRRPKSTINESSKCTTATKATTKCTTCISSKRTTVPSTAPSTIAPSSSVSRAKTADSYSAV